MPGNSKTQKHYSHDLMAQRALDFIRESQDRPFFLYAAFTLAHFSSPAEDPDRLAVPSTDPYTDTSWSEPAKKYAAMVTRLDRDVGRITELVDELGITENTLIIFTSDNGPWEGLTKAFNSSGPLRGGKRTLYEGGIRVPFIASWPGKVRQDRVSYETIAFWDLLPTLAEIAGTKASDRIDGISVLPALLGEKQLSHHEYLYWDYGHNRTTYHQAVRLNEWKGIRKGRDQEIELYDLDTDLGEAQNLAGEYPNVVSQVAAIMEEAAVPSERYPVGERYQGKPVWRASDHW